MFPPETPAPRTPCNDSFLSRLGRTLRRRPAGLVAAAAVTAAVAGTALAGAAAPAAAGAAFPAAAAGHIALPASAAAVRSPALGMPFAALQAPAGTGHRDTTRLLSARRAGGQATARTEQAPAARPGPRNLPGHVRQHNPCGSSPLHRWICSAESIMLQHGTPRSAIDTGAAFIVVQLESGGNPHAANGWDTNATAGTPSEGIAQTIAPTFSTYALPGHRDIWNPVDNMVAAFRYAISRYGSMSDIPGVVAVRHGGSYVGY